MLIVNKNLNPKGIRGKKYRSPAFTMSAIFSIPFAILAIVTSASIPPREGRGALITLLVIVWMALPVALLLASEKHPIFWEMISYTFSIPRFHA